MLVIHVVVSEVDCRRFFVEVLLGSGVAAVEVLPVAALEQVRVWVLGCLLLLAASEKVSVWHLAHLLRRWLRRANGPRKWSCPRTTTPSAQLHPASVIILGSAHGRLVAHGTRRLFLENLRGSIILKRVLAAN